MRHMPMDDNVTKEYILLEECAKRNHIQAICGRIYPKELQEKAENIYDMMEEKCLCDGVRMISPIYFVKNVFEEGGFYSLYAAVDKLET